MSNIELERISTPILGSASYGTDINTQFANIDSNFRRIVEGEYLKGQSGDIVMLEQVNLADNSHPITAIFKAYVASLQVGGDDGIGSEEGCINSPYLYMIYTKNEETRNVVYKSSLPYTFLDPRFNPITEEANASLDKSCIIMYSEADNDFVSYNAFPNIYFNDDINEFCWKINNLETSLPARGPKGDKGDRGQVYMMRTMGLENTGDSDSKIYKLGFLNEQGSITAEMNGCLAYIYCGDDPSGHPSGHISTMRVEYVESAQSYIATSILNNSTNLYTIFSGNALKDVLTEVKPDSSFNYLFIPSKFVNGELTEAHVATTKRSGDTISIPRLGFWWNEYNQSNSDTSDDPNICIISPATINNSNSERTLPGLQSLSGMLYNNYKNTICPGGAFFGRIATGSICFDDATSSPNNKWIISQDPLSYTLLMGGPVAGGDENRVYISNSSLHVGGNATIEKELVSNSIKVKDGIYSDIKSDGHPTFTLDAESGGMRLNSLNVVGDARFGKIDSLNYEVPSIILPDNYNLNNLTAGTHSVYLTWNIQDTDRDIPTIAPGSGNKNFLQAGKPKYIINTTDLQGPSVNMSSTRIHLTFDMSKDWPPTQIEWNFGRTPETISFANGKVKIYTDFRINTDEIVDNYIIVEKGVSGIDFANYIGGLDQVTNILLTPYSAADTPDYKAYKLTFENASAFSFTDEITGVENKLMAQLADFQIKIQNEYVTRGTKFSWGDIEGAPEIPVMAMDNDNITIRSGNNSFVFPTNINNRIQNQIDSTLSSKDYVTRGTKFSWGDIEGAPEIPEFDFDGDTVTLKAGTSSFTLPANINSKIQTQIEATLSDKDYITKGTLTMMGGFNSGTNSGNTEPTIQILNKQSEGYVITDFCSFLVRYLDGNQEVERHKYLQWPIKGNVIRGVYHPSEPAGTLSMMIDVNILSTTLSITVGNDQQISVTVEEIKIDDRNTNYGLGCSYGTTKTVPWEVKLVGDKTSQLESMKNFKTSISGYLTITYEAL